MREARCRLVSVDPLPCCSTESDQPGRVLPLPTSEPATHPPSKKMAGCPQYQFQPKQSSALGMDGSWTSDAFVALCQSILCCSAKSLLCLTAPGGVESGTKVRGLRITAVANLCMSMALSPCQQGTGTPPF